MKPLFSGIDGGNPDAIAGDLIVKLEVWLDRNAPWPRNQVAPAIRLVDARDAENIAGRATQGYGSTERGFYDADTRSISLVDPWNADNAQDVGVLLHELVHHRQAVSGHWYRPGAQELPVDRLQEAWLNARVLKANVNWIAVVLESGCSRRDFHPDQPGQLT